MDIWIKGKFNLVLEEQLKVFCRLLRQILVKDMSACGEHWSTRDCFHGTCAVVAALVQKRFGGELLRASLEHLPKYAHMRSHYWNRLPNGVEIDLSVDQFEASDRELVPQGEVRTWKYVMGNPDTQKRYELLREAWNRANDELGLGWEVF